MNCKDAVAALVASFESGPELSDAQRSHIRKCERCRPLLDSAKRFHALLTHDLARPPLLDATVAAAERAVLRRRHRHATRAAAGVVLLVGVVFVTWMYMPPSALSREASNSWSIPLRIVMLFVGTIGPLLLLWYVARRMRTGEDRLYKRLKKGRQLSGVCLGIAEGAHLNVSVIRLLFVALFFARGVGLWLYLLLDLMMLIHPEDRKHLLRFKARRWARRIGLTWAGAQK